MTLQINQQKKYLTKQQTATQKAKVKDECDML